MNQNPLTLAERLELVASIGDPNSDKSVIKIEELRTLLEKKPSIKAYDGFEPSGRMHIAQGLMKTVSVNKLTKAGVDVVFWVADWFAMLNNKLGGDLAKIRTCGEYLIEVWKACGMDMSRVTFLWAADEINSRPEEYWSLVLEIARVFTVARTKRCGQIMGRIEGKENRLESRRELIREMVKNRQSDAELSEEEMIEKYAPQGMQFDDGTDGIPNAQLLYPMMQCADIFFLKADICQLGMDQIKVNVLAREFCEKTKRKFPPIIVSHHMLMGLKEGQAKMSKSDPDSAIFMEDSEDDVRRKIKQAFCRPGDTETNPILDYCEYIIFPSKQNGVLGAQVEFLVERSEENGGNVVFNRYEELKESFGKEQLHPKDLKKAVQREINALLEPVRQHFKTDAKAKNLFAKVKKFKLTK